MSKISALLLALFLIASCASVVSPAESAADVTENSWATKARMPQAISGVKAAAVNGKIYVMVADVNFEYDPATDTWSTKTPMPTSREGFGVTACQNKIYVIGGNGWVDGKFTYFSVNEVYDPLTDTWETRKPMPTSRGLLEANVVNGKIYLIGGSSYSYFDPYVSVNEVYDPVNDLWTAKQPALIAVDNYVSAVVDGKIYVMAGGAGSEEPLNKISNQIYDVENDTWSFGASLPTRTLHAAAGATTGVMAPKRIYVIGGGILGNVTTNLVYVYDPALDAWSSGAPMPTNRTGLAVGVVDDVLYVMGGAVGWEGGDWPFSGAPSLTNVVELYIPFGYGTVPAGNNQPAPFPTALVAVASVATVAAVGVVLLVFFKKRKHKKEMVGSK